MAAMRSAQLIEITMKKCQITVDPNQDIGVSVVQSFIAFEGVHDVGKSPISNKRRFVINLTPDDILWTIEALAKELPEVLHDEAIARIEALGTIDDLELKEPVNVVSTGRKKRKISRGNRHQS